MTPATRSSPLARSSTSVTILMLGAVSRPASAKRPSAGPSRSPSARSSCSRIRSGSSSGPAPCHSFTSSQKSQPPTRARTRKRPSVASRPRMHFIRKRRRRAIGRAYLVVWGCRVTGCCFAGDRLLGCALRRQPPARHAFLAQALDREKLMRRRARKGGGRQLELRIKAIGAQGDGIALYQGRPVFVPFTLPGDHLRVRLEAERHGGSRATPLELLAEGEGRRVPPCPHFGTCGGCQLQHLAPEHYRAWEDRLIPDALERQGIEGVPLRAPIFIPPGSRRRAALTFRRRGGRLELGFHERHSRAVVDLETCLLLTPELLALQEPLRQLLEGALPGEPLGDVLLLHAENGFDLLLITPGSPDLVAREEFVKFA